MVKSFFSCAEIDQLVMATWSCGGKVAETSMLSRTDCDWPVMSDIV